MGVGGVNDELLLLLRGAAEANLLLLTDCLEARGPFGRGVTLSLRDRLHVDLELRSLCVLSCLILHELLLTFDLFHLRFPLNNVKFLLNLHLDVSHLRNVLNKGLVSFLN